MNKNMHGCFNFFIFLILAALITLTILAFTAPQHEHTYRKSLHNDIFRWKKEECKQDEIYNEELELCAPITYTPTPVNWSLMDRTTRACNSFYQHMSGLWIKNHKNENRGFGFVYRKNMKNVHTIVKDPKSGPIYDFYRSCLDTLVHKGHGTENRQQMMHLHDQITNQVETHSDLAIAFARLMKHGFHAPFAISIMTNPIKPEMIPMLACDTIPGYTDVITQHLNAWHVRKSTTDFIQYAKGPEFRQDLTTMDELVSMAPQNFWEMYLTELNGRLKKDLVGKQAMWVPDQEYFREFLGNLKMFTIKQWKAYIRASINYSCTDFMPVLPDDSYFRAHDLLSVTERVQSIAKETRDFTSTQCIMAAHKLLPGLVSSQFLHRDVRDSEKTRARITQVVKNLRSAYAKLIENTDWMSPATKKLAVDKIRSIIVRVMHPNVWETEPFAPRITKDRYLRNLDMIRRHRVARNLELWTKSAIDRDTVQRFGAPLTTVNAYYSPTTNTITVFAGIIQEPFYSDKFSDMAVYATLGMVCAHELSHGLDPTGRMFDANGSLTEWWLESDIKAFNKKSQCIVDEFISPAGCENANYGDQTLGEDMADITGITIAWNAYMTANPTATNTEKRQFFQVFAQMWAESYDQDHLCGRIKSDVHAVAQYRVDKTLRQMEPFHKAFGCQPGDPMVSLNKCKIYG